MASRDIFSLLKEDHQQVATLLTQLKNTHDPVRRSHLFDDVRGALDVHASAEEDAIYPRLESEMTTEDLALNAEEDHDEIRACLEILENLDPEEENWEPAVRALERTVLDHVKEEETEVFAALKADFDEGERRQMKRDFLLAKKGGREELAA